jgi:hypothetical protein
MKTYSYGIDCWQGYVNKVKELIERDLTPKEYPALMQMYINSVSTEDAVKKLNKA